MLPTVEKLKAVLHVRDTVAMKLWRFDSTKIVEYYYLCIFLSHVAFTNMHARVIVWPYSLTGLNVVGVTIGCGHISYGPIKNRANKIQYIT